MLELYFELRRGQRAAERDRTDKAKPEGAKPIRSYDPSREGARAQE